MISSLSSIFPSPRSWIRDKWCLYDYRRFLQSLDTVLQGAKLSLRGETMVVGVIFQKPWSPIHSWVSSTQESSLSYQHIAGCCGNVVSGYFHSPQRLPVLGDVVLKLHATRSNDNSFRQVTSFRSCNDKPSSLFFNLKNRFIERWIGDYQSRLIVQSSGWSTLSPVRFGKPGTSRISFSG